MHQISNTYLLLKGINNFRKSKKLSQLDLVTEFLTLKESIYDEDLEKKHTEFASPKETSYCLFEKKTDTNIKNGEEKSYERTTRIDKSDKVSCIVQQLVDSGGSYLRHRKHVKNIATIFPKIRERERQKGRYIEIEFSENIAIKTKSEVQEAHFSGMQYALHCTIVQPW